MLQFRRRLKPLCVMTSAVSSIWTAGVRATETPQSKVVHTFAFKGGRILTSCILVIAGKAAQVAKKPP